MTPRPKKRVTDRMRLDFLESRPILAIGWPRGGLESLQQPYRKSIDRAIAASKRGRSR